MIDRKASFVLAGTDHGTLIVNRFDWVTERDPNYAVGVGCSLLEQSHYMPKEIDLALGLLALRREYRGPGVIAIDGGANVGVHTVEWARAMTGYGQVLAFEPQERIFYALAGNIVLNNCHNAFALNVAIGNEDGTIDMPVPDYTKPGSYGGLELKPPAVEGLIGTGQEPIALRAPVKIMKLDSLDIPRVDLIKLDLEGMELEALAGAEGMIEEHRPVLLVEFGKSGFDAVLEWLRGHGYEAFQFTGNFAAAHRLDKCLDHLRHLHSTLLSAEADCKDWNVEWLNMREQAA